MNKIAILTLGCSKNTVDSERLLHQLKLNDFATVDNPNDADTLIINTCGFIEDAKTESINTILAAGKLKEAGKLQKIIVFGCLSERYKTELAKEIPEVDIFFGVEEYEKIITSLNGTFKPNEYFKRTLTTPSHYAYLKISEGCNNPCSFCAIPLIRGKFRSFNESDLLSEAKSLAENGVRELNILAQDTTYFGLDTNKKRTLSKLLNKLSEIEQFEWIRLLYTYPKNFPIDVIHEMKDNPKICKYLDIPLQHVSDNILASMNRGITYRETADLIYRIRDILPEIAIRTTFIVGYPGETDKDFQLLRNFVEEMRFEKVGVFKYSAEDGTEAFKLGDPISKKLKEDRHSELMKLQSDISFEINQQKIGKEIKIIIDSIEGDYYIGRSSTDAPEVDGEVLVPFEKKLLNIGDFYNATIYESNEYDLFAKCN